MSNKKNLANINETRSEREKANIYIKENGNITSQKTNINVRNHNFYGK